MNSKIILCKNINLDIDYKNVLNYTEQQMLELCNSSAYKVASAENYSFVNKHNRNSIIVGWSYATCLSANYIAFQNPDYSNKWFFAFITDVKYFSEKATQITFKIDAFSTWWDEWTVKPCFVVREHVSDDTVGLHTVPEGLETGDYIVNNASTPFNMGDLSYILSTTESFRYSATASYNIELIKTETGQPAPSDAVTGGVYNGIFSGVNYYVASKDNLQYMIGAINKIINNGTASNINGLFVLPTKLIGAVNYIGTESAHSLLYKIANTQSAYTDFFDVSKQTTLNGYQPLNKKLLCYPYNYLAVNGAGGNGKIYKYELSSNSDKISFDISSAITPGGSIRIAPFGYDGISSHNFTEGLSLGKFPICNFAVDMYVNWLTQNSVNVGGYNISSDVFNMYAGLVAPTMAIASGDIVGGGLSLGANIFNSLKNIQAHEKMPTSIQGDINCGDVITSSGDNTFHFLKMSIKREFAEIIDGYFTRFGYKVNKMKTPTFSSRPHWNYVEIGSGEIIGTGSVNKEYMDEINNVFRRGVTIWHHHNEIGNYNLDNSLT